MDRQNNKESGIGVPWQLSLERWKLFRPVVPVAEADQGVAPVIAMPAVLRVGRRRQVTKRDLAKKGYTYECQERTPLAAVMHIAKFLHEDRCRDRIGELMQKVTIRDEVIESHREQN